MLITLPTIELAQSGDLLFEIGRSKARRAKLNSFRSYGVADSPPLNTALSTLAYSTNGSAYTDLENVLNVEPSGRVAKIIERRRKGQTIVEKFKARIDHGTLKVTMEYGSALFAIFDALFLAGTKFYFRDTMDDTGGTAGSKMVYYGPLSGCDAPATPGDDADEELILTMAVETMTFTPGS